MSTGMRYFQVDGYNILHGSLRKDTPVERVVWFGLMALCSLSRVWGEITSNAGEPYDDDYIAFMCGVSLKEYQAALKHHIEQGRVKITEHGALKLVNWDDYQNSRYARVAKHRNKKKSQINETPSVSGETKSVSGETKSVSGETKHAPLKEEKRIEENIKELNNLSPKDDNIDKHFGKPKSKKPEYDAEFEEIWKSAPHHPNDNKRAAYKYYKATLNRRNDVTAGILLEAVKIYKASAIELKTDPVYIMHMSKFFGRDEHWEIYIKQGYPKSTNTNESKPPFAIDMKEAAFSTYRHEKTHGNLPWFAKNASPAHYDKILDMMKHDKKTLAMCVHVAVDMKGTDAEQLARFYEMLDKGPEIYKEHWGPELEDEMRITVREPNA